MGAVSREPTKEELARANERFASVVRAEDVVRALRELADNMPPFGPVDRFDAWAQVRDAVATLDEPSSEEVEEVAAIIEGSAG
jgi:hypothetical protein